MVLEQRAAIVGTNRDHERLGSAGDDRGLSEFEKSSVCALQMSRTEASSFG